MQEKPGNDDLVNDDRFKELFENPDFAVDEQSHEYKQLNPVRATKDITVTDKPRALTAAEESDEERMNGDNKPDEESESESESELEGELDEKRKQKVQKELERLRAKKKRDEEANRFMNEMRAVTENESEARRNETFEKQVRKLNRIEKEKNEHRQNSRTRSHGKGEMEVTFQPKRQEKKIRFRLDDDEDLLEKHGRTKQRFAGRRSASKNQFRGM